MLRSTDRFASPSPARGARRWKGSRTLLLLLGALHAGGCYGYGATSRTPEPQERVRARLSQGGQAWLLENSGRTRTTVDGTFVRQDADAFLMAVWRSDLPGTTQFRTGVDTLRIPTHHVTTFEERRLSVGRTVLAAAVATGVVVLAASAIADAGGGSDDDGDGGTVFLTFPLRPAIVR